MNAPYAYSRCDARSEQLQLCRVAETDPASGDLDCVTTLQCSARGFTFTITQTKTGLAATVGSSRNETGLYCERLAGNSPCDAARRLPVSKNAKRILRGRSSESAASGECNKSENRICSLLSKAAKCQPHRFAPRPSGRTTPNVIEMGFRPSAAKWPTHSGNVGGQFIAPLNEYLAQMLAPAVCTVGIKPTAAESRFPSRDAGNIPKTQRRPKQPLWGSNPRNRANAPDRTTDGPFIQGNVSAPVPKPQTTAPYRMSIATMGLLLNSRGSSMPAPTHHQNDHRRRHLSRCNPEPESQCSLAQSQFNSNTLCMTQ